MPLGLGANTDMRLFVNNVARVIELDMTGSILSVTRGLETLDLYLGVRPVWLGTSP